MSILSEQLIGGGENGSSWSEKPFGDAQKNEANYAGFGGYTYAQNKEMQATFNTTPEKDRTGPIAGSKPLTSHGEQYGAVGRRMPNDATTILGQMAQMLKPTAGEGTAWNTVGGGAKMAYLFASSRSLRSLRDTTGTVRVTGGGQESFVSNASGGPFAGYDYNNHYGISNWLAEGGAGSAAVEGKEENDYEDAVEAVEASNKEIFSESVTVQTGLRNLPPQPAEGGSADSASSKGDSSDGHGDGGYGHGRA
tara:strand:+ start:14 stop:766 length:753 start_codon:yes stop_codon:yes gene_type:complete